MREARLLFLELGPAARRLITTSRGFGLASVVTLAVGIGAATLLYSAINAVFLRPLPFPEPERLLRIGGADLRRDRGFGFLSRADFLAIQGSVPAFDGLSAFRPLLVRQNSDGVDREIEISYIAGDYFALAGLTPRLGRLFLPGERDVAVLCDRVWRERYASDPNVMGRTIELRGRVVQIVGVAAPFSHILPWEQGKGTEVWSPLEMDDPGRLENRNLTIVARLARGSTMEQAEAQLETASPRLVTGAQGAPSAWKLGAIPLRDLATKGVGPLLKAAFGIAVAILLIGLGNIINLRAARNQERARDFAVRAALGASAHDLLRLGLTESLVLCTAGGALGLVLSAISHGALIAFLPRGPFSNEIRIDPSVAAFAIGISTMSVLLLTLIPRVRPGIGALSPARGQQDRESRRVRWLRQGIVGSEIGFAVAAIFLSGLLLNSLLRLMEVRLGFDPSHVSVFHLQRLRDLYPTVTVQTEFLQSAVNTLRTLPEVESVGVTSLLPLSGQTATRNTVTLDDATSSGGFLAGYRSTNGDYFRTLRATFVAGGPYVDAAGSGELAAVVNEAFVRSLRAEAHAVIGRKLKLGPPQATAPWRRITGVVADIRPSYVEDTAQPEVFVPLHQDFQFGRATLVVRSSRPPSAVLAQMRSLIDSRLLARTGTAGASMEDLLRAQLSPQRSRIQLVGFIGAIACALALIGVYGVASYAASRRMKELAIRAALGASSARIVRSLVLREWVIPVVVALLIGPLLGLMISRELGGMLYQVSASDPFTLAAATLFVLALVGGASVIPAFRACRADPARLLGSE